jgi:hypothetical protein
MHYKDGQKAELGDLVKGRPYNTPREVVGEVLGLIPGVSACNLRVGFLEARRLERAPDGSMVLRAGQLERPRMALGGHDLWSGSASELEPPAACWTSVDYGSTAEFELIARGGV